MSSFIINLNLKKETTIKLFKLISKEKYYFKKENRYKLQNSLQRKRKDLILMLRETLINLINEGYEKERLEIQIQKTYQKYKSKSHFILEGNKYKDFSQIINKIKNNIKKDDVQKHKENIKNNMILDQLHNKINKINLKYKIKEYLNKQKNWNTEKYLIISIIMKLLI
ncbi:plasmid maintenance protein [Borreliella garinii]|uniref:plasmid maintenance protein n=2 Tax=Borreliella garinii TaxID=29519 RepID=UPI002E17BE58